MPRFQLNIIHCTTNQEDIKVSEKKIIHRLQHQVDEDVRIYDKNFKTLISKSASISITNMLENNGK